MILILVMTVALSIGLSVVQKSLVDVSTASKVEQSSRAFSAAEAGIEKALSSSASLNCTDQTDTDICESFVNSSVIKEIDASGFIPAVPGDASSGLDPQQNALEFPPLAKEDIAQVWLINPTSTANPPTEFYMPSSKTANRGIEIYWGSPTAEKAALEVKIIYYNGSAYTTAPYYFDSDASRSSGNGFTNVSGDCSASLTPIDTTTGASRSFYCKRIINPSSTPAFPSSGLMLVRMRLLYNSTSQPVAVRGYGTCGQACSLPPQARIVTSTGVSGETQRTIKVFQLDKVVPPFFDYAIFSAGDITK